MGNKSKLVPGVQKFLQNLPTEEQDNFMKAHSYKFIEEKALTGLPYDSATKLIPEYLGVLS